MRPVAALVAMEIDAQVASVVISRSLAATGYGLDALLARPGLQERSVNREVLIGHEASRLGLTDHSGQEFRRHVTPKQPIAVLAEGRGVPYRVVHRQADEPTKQQVVVQLLHQQPLASHRVQHLDQQSSK